MKNAVWGSLPSTYKRTNNNKHKIFTTKLNKKKKITENLL